MSQDTREKVILTQKNPPSYPMRVIEGHCCGIKEYKIEQYRYVVECSCSWGMHTTTFEEAAYLKKQHESESQ